MTARSAADGVANDLEKALGLMADGQRHEESPHWPSPPPRAATIADACRAAIGLPPEGAGDYASMRRLDAMFSAIQPYTAGGGDGLPLGSDGWADLECEIGAWEDYWWSPPDWRDIEEVMEAAAHRARREPWTDYEEFLEHERIRANIRELVRAGAASAAGDPSA